MDDILKEKLIKWLDTLESGFANSADFAVNSMPGLLSYALFRESLHLVGGVLCLGVGIAASVYTRKVYLKEGSYAETLVPAFFVAVLGFFFGVMICAFTIKNIGHATLSPNTFLIKEVRCIVKTCR